MYGYFTHYTEAEELFKISIRLQEYIESKEPEGGDTIVSICIGPYSAAIEVDGQTLWCSESDGELSYDFVFDRFLEMCEKYAKLNPVLHKTLS